MLTKDENGHRSGPGRGCSVAVPWQRSGRERIPAVPPRWSLAIPLWYPLGEFISGCLPLLCHRHGFSPFLGAVRLLAGLHCYSDSSSQHFCALAGRCQKAVFRRLSRAASPETPRPSERELCAACQHKGLFQDSAEASVGFTGCCRGERSAAVHKEPECGHLLHLHLSQQHRVAEREEFIRQNRILKVFSLGYVKSTNPRAKACKMTVLNLPPSLRGHRVPLVLLHVDISVLTNHGLEAVSFKSVIPTVPLGWFLAVPSSLWFMHPTRDFRQRFSSFQTLANITLLKRYDYVGEHLAL